VFARSPP